MENGNNVNTEEETSEEQCLNITKGAILYGEGSSPDSVEIYKCPKCGKKFVAADILWKDAGNNKWEPVCTNPKCDGIHLEEINK